MNGAADDDRTEIERLAYEWPAETEDEAIRIFATMYRLLDEQIAVLEPLCDRLNWIEESADENQAWMQFLADIGAFYDAHCTAAESRYLRACGVWWSLMRALLHTVSNRSQIAFYFWHSALYWIRLTPGEWCESCAEQLIRLFFDPALGPIMIDNYFEEETEEQFDQLFAAAERFLPSVSMEDFRATVYQVLKERGEE